jgi:hypothetical protein
MPLVLNMRRQRWFGWQDARISMVDFTMSLEGTWPHHFDGDRTRRRGGQAEESSWNEGCHRMQKTKGLHQVLRAL